jgi:simple sugar transport system ATP-binding protein
VQQPTSGEIVYRGAHVRFRSPRDAARAGIVLVPQHPRLVDAFTVAENIALAARLAGRDMGLNEVRSRIKSLGELYGIQVDPDARVWRLSMGEKQRVEILKALILDARLMLLDEPTTHLSPMESDKLLDLVARLADEGRSVVLITHRLREVMRSADRIAVMRRGKLVGVLRRDEATQEKLLHLMFGERVPLGRISRGRQPGGEKVLVVEDLWVRGEHGELAVKGVSLDVRRYEIVGVAGVAGNGQREFFEALVGFRRPQRGRIVVTGVDVTRARPSERGRLGVAIIPEERLGWALVPGKSLVFNTALGLYSVPGGPFHGFIVDWGRA